MTSIVRVVETEALQGCEVSFDCIEPTSVCRRRNQGHAMISGILNQCLFSVRGEIIENKVYPSRFLGSMHAGVSMPEEHLGRSSFCAQHPPRHRLGHRRMQGVALCLLSWCRLLGCVEDDLSGPSRHQRSVEVPLVETRQNRPLHCS